MRLEEFIENYFEELESKINKIDIDKNIKNYLFVKDFLDRAIDFFLNIDNEILNSTLKKEYVEIEEFYNLYVYLKKKSTYPGIIFLEFLEQYDKYNSLKKEIDSIKSKINFDTKQIYILEEKLKENEDKKLRKLYVDFIDERANLKDKLSKLNRRIKKLEQKIEPIFIKKFIKKRDEILIKSEQALNSMLCKFEKKFWFRVNTSNLVKDYKEKIGIKQNFSTKTFIEFFLKKIKNYKSKNRDKILKLEKLLKELH